MQKFVNTALGLAVLGLAIAVAALALTWPEPGLDEAALRAAVADALAGQQPAAAPLETADLGATIESYLLENPRILQQVSDALDTQLRAEELETTRAALAGLHEAIYDDPANIVLGNPEGDVTLVELFDYNCTYCRQALPDVLDLIADDPNLRVILKEFPILSQGSVEAARVGVVVNQSEADYALFHTNLLTARGTIDAQAALAAAESLGLNPIALELDMQSADVTQAIERTYAIAGELGLTGTPTFIIGNEVLPGAVGRAELATRIANMRACGETICTERLVEEG